MNYLRNAWGRPVNSDEMLNLLGFRRGQHIPPEHASVEEIDGVKVTVIKSKGYKGHRIFYTCTCNRMVPFGRIAQHLARKGHP